MDARAPLVAGEGTSAGHFINQDPSMYMLFCPNHSISDGALTARGICVITIGLLVDQGALAPRQHFTLLRIAALRGHLRICISGNHNHIQFALNKRLSRYNSM